VRRQRRHFFAEKLANQSDRAAYSRMHWRARVDSGTDTVPEERDKRLAGDLPLCLVWVAVVDGRADCGHPGDRRAKPTGTFWRFRSQLRSEV